MVLGKYRGHWLIFGGTGAVLGGTGSVLGGTGWYYVVVGQYKLVLLGIKWYWISKGLICQYILKKIMVTPTDRPTERI